MRIFLKNYAVTFETLWTYVPAKYLKNTNDPILRKIYYRYGMGSDRAELIGPF